MRTTTIGAYPKPEFVAIPDWFRGETGTDTTRPTAGYAEALATLGDAAEDMFKRGARQIIADQIDAGVAIPTDGEVRRENYIHYHCRHLQGFDFADLTRRSVRNRNYDAWLPTARGPVKAGAPFLVHDWRVAQSFTDRPVKTTIPGPLTISDTVADAHYGDAKAFCAALAEAINVEALRLAEAGCRFIQIDEPVFARKVDQALDFGIENLERCLHGLGPEVTRMTHICCGYPDVRDHGDYPKAPLDAYPKLAPALDAAAVDWASLEDAHRHNDLGLLEAFTRTTVVLGVVDVARSRIEAADEVEARLRLALEHIDADRLVAAPDCGLGLLTRDQARAKLASMCAGAGRIDGPGAA